MRRPSLDLAEPSRNIEESVGTPSPDTPDPTVDMSLPPPEDELETFDVDAADSRIYTPPPHIAARLLYRPTNQTRRKDSAASSRRNSISSAPSRSSHGAGALHVGPQSKYVAQHLRRASILEDRKARLADRAAHAEKVRLRAALAKAAVKDTSLSEERALAAAQARERNLAEIAAACAEEVKRAKAIAETMKEKREQEIRKMKLQMEERLADAERRREELRSRNGRVRVRERGQSLVAQNPTLVEVMPQVEEVKEHDSIPMVDVIAAPKIQCWWRSIRRRRAVAEFSALGLSIDAVRETSFDKVTELLSQERVLMITAHVLRICGLKEGEMGSVEEMAAVRSFLSAFLILGHPSQVLSNKEGRGEQEQVGSTLAKPIHLDDLANPQSQELVGKARDLLVSFENILGRLTSFNNYTPPPALVESFPEVYATFYNAFLAWKARDSSSLVELMVMQFVELDAIWESVKHSTDGSVDQVYKESIRDNQLLLLVRIKKLAGPVRGKQMVAEAVKAARKAKAKKPIGDTKPRGAEHSTTETAMGVLAAEENRHKSQTQTPTPPTSPAQRRETFKVSIMIPNAKSLLPDNRVVVHELAIDREFRTEPHEYHEQQAHMLAPLFQQMRSTMQADDQDAHFFLLLKVADSIREKLQRLVKVGNPMHTLIGGLLDTDIARRQFSTGSFSYEKFFQAMGSLLPKLCAPVRDDEVKQLIDEKLSQGNYVDRLEALNGFIDIMLSDYANYMLQLAAPQLIEEAPAYEAKSFAADIQSGKFGLSAASAAWRAAREKLVAEACRRDPEGVDLARSRPTANRIYNQMLLDVFTHLAPLSLEEMPEMLRLDHKRALESGRLARRIITTGAILLQCKNLLKRDVRAPWKSEAQRIMLVLEKSELSSPQMAVDGIMAALEAGRSMPVATKAHLRALVSKFVIAGAELVTQTTESEPREPVLRLLLNRLKGYVLARIAAASATEKVKATSTAGEKLASLGLAEFVDKVRDMVDMISRVSSVDRDAHGVWWDTVAEAAEKAVDAAATASSSTTVASG
ncbi:T-complex protein 11-domain-containing protein [Apodospora peruviana]|uniref:T-complex protein 11-domain-containing protein n=1 Tax=Apodospora peruviana TaxID=516989 RepID=A0AAE0IBE7_9PEZI|nr:T-complex protein 11-domain-containing protein [Apodospora peruviana]